MKNIIFNINGVKYIAVIKKIKYKDMNPEIFAVYNDYSETLIYNINFAPNYETKIIISTATE